ncbi:hypothetical protein NLI96_g6217 [Meripilus lineatus]|uniref:PARP catalytic domain-containing protein n=1 Tax=Meripilus lineatus TaxID=2056292 RepID=A0AAD5YE42_9APHY|nr:hypothetical protein NLI96_g6217 [Physisporinus lineatus]
MILEIPEEHVAFQSVAAQFKKSWRQTFSNCPPVRHVYKVIVEQASLDKYNAYRDAVEARGDFVKAGRSAGNEHRRWHGTKRQSTRYVSLYPFKGMPTDDSNVSSGNFGPGIYTSSTSSKSDDYSVNSDPQSPLSAMILNKVVVGKGFKTAQTNTSLRSPPAGFDSVLFEIGPDRTDDELIVYDNEAIRPSYLVVYDETF